jgi:hypothetical protein
VARLDCESIDEALASRLLTRVRSGGAALLFLGPRVNPYEYNQRLFRDGTGLLPCPVSAPVAERRILSLRPFPRLASPGFDAGTFAPDLSAFVPLKPDSAADVATFGTLAPPGAAGAGGTAAILERAVGRGRSIVVALPPDLTWSTFPATAEFALLTQDLLRELIGRPDERVNLEVGQTFEQPVLVSAQPLLLATPGGRYERLAPDETRDGWRVRYAGTRRHGVYEVMTTPEVLRRRRFVVNVGTQESDLAKASPDDLRGALGGGWTYVSQRESWSDSVGRRYATTEIAPALLWMLTAVLAGEVFLAGRFGRRRGGAARKEGRR